MILRWDLFFAFIMGGLVEWFWERMREYKEEKEVIGKELKKKIIKNARPK